MNPQSIGHSLGVGLVKESSFHSDGFSVYFQLSCYTGWMPHLPRFLWLHQYTSQPAVVKVQSSCFTTAGSMRR